MDIVEVKGIFLRYILLPLIVILLAVLLGYLKKQVPKIKAKTITIYVLVADLCIGIPGVFGFSGNMFNPYWYLFAMLIYLFLGILHVHLLSKYFNDSSRPVWFMMIFETLLTCICMLLGSYIFYLIFNLMSPFEGYAVMAATSVFIFMVPLSFYYCFIQYINIPFDIHKTWVYTMGDVNIDFQKIEFTSLLLLNIELTKTVSDGQKSRIDAKSPSDGVSVGDWFYKVVDDYNHKYPNSPIHLTDSSKEPYYWIFYTKKSIFHFRRFIDFDKTMTENKISNHTTVFCKRVINNEIEYNKSNNKS